MGRVPTIAAYTDAPDSGLYPCQLFEHGFVPGLRQAGINADYIPTKITGKALKLYIDGKRPDYFAFLGGWLPEYEELCAVAHAHGIGLIYWATEDPCAFRETLPTCVRHADIVLSTAMECVEQYRIMGKRAGLLTFGCNPDYHAPGTVRFDYVVDWAAPCSFYAGHACRRRGFESIIRPCVESPYSGFVSGHNWFLPEANTYFTARDIRRPWIPCAEMPDLYSSVKINIGLQCDDTSTTQSSMRPYEVLSCGGFLLCQRTPALEQGFTEYEHLVLSDNAEHTRDLLDYFLQHEDDRLAIAQAGQAFVREHYSYARLLREHLFPLLGLSA
jgi:hypothetical protein